MNRCTAGTAMTRSKCGDERCFWSMRIYEHLKRQGITGVTLAHDLGVTKSAVSKTISGRYHSVRVLDALRAAGVPEKYLFDPRRVSAPGKEAA